METRLREIKTELNAQWNKPKLKNVKNKKFALAIVKKTARDYKKIAALHKERNELKSN